MLLRCYCNIYYWLECRTSWAFLIWSPTWAQHPEAEYYFSFLTSIFHSSSSKVMLQVLYKLKTAKVFERARGKEEKPTADIVEEDPFAIQTLSWCPESRMLCVAGVSAHVIVYRFSKQEITTEVVQVGKWSVINHQKHESLKPLSSFYFSITVKQNRK